MALETLKDVKKIGRFPVIVMDDLRQQYPEKFNESGAMDYQWFETEIRPFHFIYVRHDVNSISFTLQNGPIKEVRKQRLLPDFAYFIFLAENPDSAEYVPEQYIGRAETEINNNSDLYREFEEKHGVEYSGINGCQVDTIIETAKKILEGLNAKFPSEYNKTAIDNLDLAIKALQQRTKDREARGVEGTSNE